MSFAHGQTVWRDRRADDGPDPYNPARTVKGDWDETLSTQLEGVYLDVPSAAAPSSATRSQVLSERVLFAPPGTDVRKGDRIRIGGTFVAPGEAWYVNVPPAIVSNPFTGTQFPTEIALELTEG